MPTKVPHTLDAPQAESPEHAIRLLLEHAQPVATERVALDQAHGRVLAEQIRADRASPAADVSAMDGYAVRTGDAGRLPVLADIPAGVEPIDMPAGGVVRVMTGSCVPAGADLVIKREDVDEQPDAITIDPALAADLRPGLNIRRRGENIQAGESVANRGVEITPALVGVLASFGHHRVEVYRRVEVAILTTGDEVVPADVSPRPWQLHDSNGPTLAAFFAGASWVAPAAAVHVRDDRGAIRAEIASALEHADVLVLSGGVSMGDRDYVPAVLREVGARTLFHGVPQRPGRPTLAAVSIDGQPIVALPGNPVSVAVTARRLVRPVLHALGGLTRTPSPRTVTLVNPDGKSLPLWWHRLVRLVPGGLAESVGTKGSGDLVSAARADGFVVIPPGEPGPGPFEFHPWTL